MRGQAQFRFTWEGSLWRFASAEHRDLFMATPEKYAPQFGGYCAWAVSHGYTADGDPEAWRIVDGKLYVNYSKRVQKRLGRRHPGLHRQRPRELARRVEQVNRFVGFRLFSGRDARHHTAQCQVPCDAARVGRGCP